MMPTPTRAEWLIEGELRGHTSAETIAYLDQCADFEDELARRARRSSVLLGGDFEPWWVTRLRARFGR
jgi:hypothetical protein